MRLFVAIGIPDHLRPGLTALQSGVPGARWVRPENFHLTLCFIGEVDGAMAHDIDGELLRIQARSFELALGGVGYFGASASPRALYAAAAPDPALVGLQKKIEAALIRIGAKPDRKKFTPHVSLARFGARAEAGHHLAQFMASHSLFKCPPFPVRHFALYSSMVGKAGSIYRVEAEYPLA